MYGHIVLANMKICAKCKERKEYVCFSKDSNRKDGLYTKCKECVRNNYIKNREKNLARQAKYDLTHKEEKDARQAKYTKEHKKEKALYDHFYGIKNKEKKSIRMSFYAKETAAMFNARSSRRRAAKLKRTLPWLTEEQLNEIQEVYTLAKELQWLSEEKLEVDHIVPLQGENVSGLHVPWNLQILPKSHNLSKKNKFK